MHLPLPPPREFRYDVVSVARSRKDGVNITQLAKDFGFREPTLHKWFHQSDVDYESGS